MNAKIKWDREPQGVLAFGDDGRRGDDPWLGTPLGQSAVERPRAEVNPFAFAAPAPARNSRVSWLGAVENTPGYQACIGKKIQDCGVFFPNWSSDPEQKKGLDACIQGAKDLCKIEAEAVQGWTPSKQEVMNLQNDINVVLKKYNYCPIGVDGSLGGETCGAAIWAKGAGGAVVIPAQCNYTKNTFQLKDCPPGGGGQVVVKTCPDTPCPPNQDCVNGKCYPACGSGQQHDPSDPSKCVPVPTKTAGGETPWGLFALGAAAVGAIALVFVKAPKGGLPPREAERAMPEDNPKRRKKSRRRAA